MKKLLLTGLLSAAFVLQGLFAMPAAAQVYTGTATASTYGYPQPTTYCPTFTYNLYRGLSDYYTGGQVSQLQQFLAYRGYAQTVTGYYGAQTTNNVAQFQRQYNVYPITGGVGPLTRAAIATTCNGGGISTSGTFYLNQPFTVSVNQTAQQYAGQLDVTLNSVSNSLYTYTPYPGYSYGQSAIVTLGQRCQTGTQCFYYPTQQFTLTQGQSTTWQGYTITLNSISGNSATFVVTSGSGSGTTQGSLSVNQTSGSAPLVVSFSGSLTNSGQYIIDYGDGQTSGPIQTSCVSNQSYPNYYGSQYNCTVSAGHTYTSQGTYTATLQPYIACMYSNPRCMIATVPLGQVTITVSGGVTVGGLTVSSPTTGQTYNRGGQMQITWGYPVTPNSTQVAIELYTASGSRIGLIAVSSNTSGTYTWSIPSFPQNYMCTLQYPNALCGTDIPTGQYYIKVSATNNPLDSNPTVIASGQSGVFTIQQ